ncbi:hypothetical protein A5742_14720 [Mycolicibacterium fortuitum]|uniref:Pyridoxamine 5'-phosphate oxidase putative domain-containing protein n=1 Tax=Mycolicibacterium fortuitum TaxID=1766 RepID=A0ABD6QCE8_MYCFO|nr:hypothetical protein A5742_14720 [Mycolicibacterium fortuitum]
MLPEAVEICRDDAHLLEPLRETLSYTHCVSVAVGSTRRPVCPAFALLFPSTESADIVLMFLDHNKPPDRAPARHGLLSVLWETDASGRVMELPDDEIVAKTMDTVYATCPKLRGHVEFTHVTR